MWVSYRLSMDILNKEKKDAPTPPEGKNFWATIGLIAVADISMSLDNILAIAGIARNNPFIMVIGLILSIACLAVASKVVSGLLEKFTWLNWAGVGLIGIIAVELIFGFKAV